MNISKLIEKIKSKKIFKNKLVITLVVCVLIAVAMMIFVSTFTDKKEKVSNKNNAVVASCSSSVLEYSNAVASQIENMLSSVNGLSNIKVVVVVESAPQIRYLMSGDGETQNIILEKQSSITKPVVVTELAPKINGILIVAKGANNLLVKNKVISALSAVYSVDMSKIDILEGK